MSSGGRFLTLDSPLQGRVVPMGWGKLSLEGKRRALVLVGYARDYREACSVLGKHAGAVRSGRARRERRVDRMSRGRGMWWNK